jgi:uncharacterized protein (DUF58 family)
MVAGDKVAGRRPEPSSLLGRAEARSASFPPLLVAAERVASTVAQGVHGRRRVGQGESFWQFRRYQPGDSVQRVDWRRSARSDHIYIRQTEWEAAQSVWLWRDTSASMTYASKNALPVKQEQADILLLALASLLSRGGEHIALLSIGGQPAPGQAALSRIATLIDQGAKQGENLPAGQPLPRHGHLILFSDFLSPLPDIWGAVQAYAGGGVSGHLVRIVDPAEETFPFMGRMHFEGCEAEGGILLGRADAVRGEYRDAFVAHGEGLKALAQAVGWPLIVHRTDQSLQSTLLALYLHISESMGR